LGFETYGLVNQKTRLLPPGVTFIRAPNDEWKMVAQRLIRRAHTIMLVVYPHQNSMGNGFAWEIEQIVSCGVQSRVVLILPSDGSGWWVDRRALDQADVILTSLNEPGGQAGLAQFSVAEYESQHNSTPLIMKYTENGTLWYWKLCFEESVRKADRRTKRSKLIAVDKHYYVTVSK
jgi:hypothetical protein